MATSRRTAAAEGQRPTPSSALRSRVPSGIPIGTQPLKFLRLLDELREVIESIGPPCRAYAPTSAPLLGFDGYALSKPFSYVDSNLQGRRAAYLRVDSARCCTRSA